MMRELEGGGVDHRLVSGMGAPLNGDARAHKDDSTQLEARRRQQCSGGRGALSHPVFKPKPNAHSMCAHESSLHTYRTENGDRITNVSI
jgi:hypothetical protein